MQMVQNATLDNDRPAAATKPSGTFRRVDEKVVAFTPAMLPPRMRLDNPIIRKIIEAERALSGLNALTSRLVNPESVIWPYMAREAAESSHMSGIPATVEDLMRHEVSSHTTATVLAELRIQESLNCLDAIMYCMDKIKDGAEIDIDLIRETHGILAKGSKGAGRLRRAQKFNPAGGVLTGNDIVVPTAPNNVRELLANMLEYASRTGEVSRLVQCAFMQYQFEAISPFDSGNGRMARLLALAYMYKCGLTSGPFVYMGAYYSRRHTHYRQKMESVRMRSRWREWLVLFLDGVIAQSAESVAVIEGLSALRINYGGRLKNPNALALVDMLLSNPYITISGAAAALDIGYTAAKNAVEDLMTHGVLDRADMALRNRLFRASEIVDVQRGKSRWGSEAGP